MFFEGGVIFVSIKFHCYCSLPLCSYRLMGRWDWNTDFLHYVINKRQSKRRVDDRSFYSYRCRVPSTFSKICRSITGLAELSQVGGIRVRMSLHYRLHQYSGFLFILIFLSKSDDIHNFSTYGINIRLHATCRE